MSGSEIVDILLSLLTLTVLEIVLGVDNLVFLAITSGRLPPHQRARARRLGLTLAWLMRLLLLASAVWLSKLSSPLFLAFGFEVSGRDVFLMVGGLFLLFKATQEIHAEMEESAEKRGHKFLSFSMVIAQITILDIVFSLDSVLTAVGLTHRYWVMVVAITVAIIGMIFSSEILTHFIEKHPTVKMLALSFLLLIGMILIADACHFHVPRTYIYFAISFSILVESLNYIRRKKKVVAD